MHSGAILFFGLANAAGRIASVFTVAELDEMLPASIEVKGNRGDLTIRIGERNGRRHYDVCYLHNLDHVRPRRPVIRPSGCAGQDAYIPNRE